MLRLELRDGALRLLRSEKELYALRPDDTFCRIGNGKNTFSMTRGSFTIKEKDLSLKPLRVREITLPENAASLALTEGTATLTVCGDRLDVSFRGLDDYNRMVIELPAVRDEHVYGTGETFNASMKSFLSCSNWRVRVSSRSRLVRSSSVKQR